jgi:hypothetical protein
MIVSHISVSPRKGIGSRRGGGGVIGISDNAAQITGIVIGSLAAFLLLACSMILIWKRFRAKRVV